MFVIKRKRSYKVSASKVCTLIQACLVTLYPVTLSFIRYMKDPMNDQIPYLNIANGLCKVIKL